MKETVELRDFFLKHRHQNEMILCTLVGKIGSSFRGLGAKKIILLNEEDRESACGLMSGGCLEASIEKTARQRFHELPFTEKFNTLSDEDRLFGYQTGCQGEIELKFEKIDASADIDLFLPYNPVHLVLIGCGADADPYLPLTKSLGWTLELIDHRRDLADASRFPGAKVRHIPVSEIANELPTGPRVAVVLMTHNYEVDMEILRGMSHSHYGYVGSLGPYRRFERLQKDLEVIYGFQMPEAFVQQVHAPAGIYLRGQAPSEIALSVVAQIQGELVEHPRDHVWTLILAAGAAKRFGGPKPLAQWKTDTLLGQAMNSALQPEHTVVITGGHDEVMQPYLQGVNSVYNAFWNEGMGTSIRCGIEFIQQFDPNAETIVILPVDQPLVSRQHLQNLVNESRLTNRCALTTNDQGVVGAPAALPQSLFEKGLKLRGDRGLKSVLTAGEIILVENNEALQDADTPQELQKLVLTLNDSI